MVVIKKCEHTKAQQRSCKCNWVVRYRINGRQREKSFLWNQKEIATNWGNEIEYSKTKGDVTDPKLGSVKFAEAAGTWVSKRRAPLTRKNQGYLLSKHINPAIGGMTLTAVASATGRVAVEELLTVTMPKNGAKSANRIKEAYTLIRAVLNDAIRRGVLTSHKLHGIELDAAMPKAEFVFPTREQLETLAARLPVEYRITVWLMRGCGLRIGEALGVSKSDFQDGMLTLRGQQYPDRSYGPLKHRKEGETRVTPVPSYVTKMVDAWKEQEDGHMFAPLRHVRFHVWFRAARVAAGLPDSFTPHSLRHVFASVCLGNGVPITDVSAWLGHRNINTTYAIYGHLVPSSWDRAKNVLDTEYDNWSHNSTLKQAA